MSSKDQHHLTNDERRIMDLALRRSVTILEDPRDGEILRLRAQVAALLKVKEAAERVDHHGLVILANMQATGSPYHGQVAAALVLMQGALTAHSEWEKTNADK